MCVLFRMVPETLSMLGKDSATELHLQSYFKFSLYSLDRP